MTTTPLTDAPPLILVIADAALETLPAPWREQIRGCEAQYHRGKWFVTVPAHLWNTWPQRKEPTP